MIEKSDMIFIYCFVRGRKDFIYIKQKYGMFKLWA